MEWIKINSLTLLGDSVSPWNNLFIDCFLSELVLKCMNILFNLVLLGVDESMDVSMSQCGLPMGLVWLSKRKQSPNKLFQGDTLSPNKVKL